MPDEVIPFPRQPDQPNTRRDIQQSSRYTFRIGNRSYPLDIPTTVSELRPKLVEVVPISTKAIPAEKMSRASGLQVLDCGQLLANRKPVHGFGLLSLPARVMNVLTTMDVARRGEMKTFTIDTENKVGTEAEQSHAPGANRFSSMEEFAEMTQDWPLSRLVAAWNGLPGVRAVNRFTDRKTAVRRIWKTLQSPAGEANGSLHSAKRRGIRRKKATAREGSKKARILTLLKQPKGASLHEIMHATGWQAHSVRGFISGNLVKKMGLKVNSTRRSGGERSYQLMRG